MESPLALANRKTCWQIYF